MGKPHSIELRERVVSFVDEGNGHRDAARHFRVSPKFVNDMMKLRRETGALLAKPQGNRGRTGKLNGLSAWVRERLAGEGDLTLDELCLELAREHGVVTHRSSVGRWLQRLRLSHKKTPASIVLTWRFGGGSGSPGGSLSWLSFWTVWSLSMRPRSTPRW